MFFDFILFLAVASTVGFVARRNPVPCYAVGRRHS
jgi:hypothetical protein